MSLINLSCKIAGSSANKLITRCFTTNLPNDIKVIQDLCRKFTIDKITPIAAQNDRSSTFPAEQIKELGQMGFMGIGAPLEYGGSNLTTLALSVIVEELSRGCASIGAIVSIHNCLYSNLLSRVGSLEQKDKWLRGFTSGKKIGAFALSESGEAQSSIKSRVVLSDICF